MGEHAEDDAWREGWHGDEETRPGKAFAVLKGHRFYPSPGFTLAGADGRELCPFPIVRATRLVAHAHHFSRSNGAKVVAGVSFRHISRCLPMARPLSPTPNPSATCPDCFPLSIAPTMGRWNIHIYRKLVDA